MNFTNLTKKIKYAIIKKKIKYGGNSKMKKILLLLGVLVISANSFSAASIVGGGLKVLDQTQLQLLVQAQYQLELNLLCQQEEL